MEQKCRNTRPKNGRRAGAKREKGDMLVINTQESKYSAVLKAMTSDAKCVDLGADVRRIRCTPTSDSRV